MQTVGAMQSGMVAEKQTAVSPIASPISRPANECRLFCILGFWGTAVTVIRMLKFGNQFVVGHHAGLLTGFYEGKRPY